MMMKMISHYLNVVYDPTISVRFVGWGRVVGGGFNPPLVEDDHW